MIGELLLEVTIGWPASWLKTPRRFLWLLGSVLGVLATWHQWARWALPVWGAAVGRIADPEGMHRLST